MFLQKWLDGVYVKDFSILTISSDFLYMKRFKIGILLILGCWQYPWIVSFDCRFDCGDFNAGHLLLKSYGQILHLEISFFKKCLLMSDNNLSKLMIIEKKIPYFLRCWFSKWGFSLLLWADAEITQLKLIFCRNSIFRFSCFSFWTILQLLGRTKLLCVIGQ